MKKRFLCLFLALTVTFCGCTGEKTPAENITSEEINESVDVKVEDSAKEEADAASVDNGEDMNIHEEEKLDRQDKEIIPLKDAVSEKMGGFIGCALAGNEINDEKVWDIVTTHFNAVTLGNELKPDAIFNYSTAKVPGTHSVELNGESIVVPNVNYDRAEKMLNKILKYNEENPDHQIKVRGHVLVWHSQTPEWFFHEDYDKKKPYADKDTMNKRLEWYIKTVLTHFTGEDSKYKDLFYGWDVVNEAISDGTGKLRSDKENPNESLNDDRHGSNSSWWHIYESNEFIINAFKYANKYAPADLELYYNDYNETNINKRNGIIELLQAIKDEEGPSGTGTRIDAMGMQGHYGIDSPAASDVSNSIKAYAKVVGKVQITEFDISASSDYDGSEDKKADENEKLRKRYNMLYYEINSANNESYVEVEGITFWGTVDHYSWLQSRSNVGGGNKTGLPQMPLLFDENYQPKPCFYVFD